MIALLAASVLVARPIPLESTGSWLVLEFEDRWREDENLGQDVARALSFSLEEARCSVIEPLRGSEIVRKMNFAATPATLVCLRAIGERAFLKSPGRGILVRGEIIEYRVDKLPGKRKRGVVGLRASAYDVSNAILIGGALVKGESAVQPQKTPDRDLIAAAIRQATRSTATSLIFNHRKDAEVVGIDSGSATLDRGSRDGYRNDDLAYVMRGGKAIATVVMQDVQSSTTKVASLNDLVRIRVGDRVQPSVDSPLLPKRGVSVLDKVDIR